MPRAMEGGRDRRLAYIQVRASTGSPSWACVGHWNAAPKCKSSVCSVLSLFCVPVRLQAPSGSSSWECWPSLEASSPPSPTGEHLPEISRTADGQAGRREASRLFPGSPAAVAPPPPPPPPLCSVFGGMTTFLFANVIASGVKIIVSGSVQGAGHRVGARGQEAAGRCRRPYRWPPSVLLAAHPPDHSPLTPSVGKHPHHSSQPTATTHTVASRPSLDSPGSGGRAPEPSQPHHHGLLLCPRHRRHPGAPVVSQ